MVVLEPYLNFNGDCAAAMNFYQSIFGGTLKTQTYKESGRSQSMEDDSLIMHAYLKSDTISFMASDGNAKYPVTMGDNIQMSLTGDDDKKLTDYFDKLSAAGKIDMPLKKEFWGDTFGMLTDQFGIHWMVNITSKK